jgi:hypothetical protein
MNISTGGPHILLFERDSQLTALLMSEFQLAGYECHTARTAVEVFDAIARYPIRLVLVNLAQAAAARREFWVALDTQRRGRAVQVLTFHCTNLAGYGARDSEDRSQTTPADMEVDGMLGLMNLVDAVRTRVPGVGATTNTLARAGKTPAPMSAVLSQDPELPSTISPIVVQSAQITGKPPAIPINGASSPGGVAFRADSFADTTGSSTYTIENQEALTKAGNTGFPQSPALPPGQSSPPSTATSSSTDKIRTARYPHQHATNPRISATTVRETTRPTYETASRQQAFIETLPMDSSSSLPAHTSMLQHLADEQRGIEGQPESGLDQLSRMIQERRNPLPEGDRNALLAQVSEPTSVQLLRASPIQDVPIERAMGGQPGEGGRRGDVAYGHKGQQQTAPTPIASLASIAMPSPAATPLDPPPPQVAQLETEEDIDDDVGELAIPLLDIGELAAPPLVPPLSEGVEETGEGDDTSTPGEQGEQIRASMASNATLLEVVQALPPAPSPSPSPVLQPPQQTPQQSPQSQGLSGRAIRSLGRVLLEGHLVPQNRLEVAQDIQRLLRGVDLNYQLGEILLMFKLLTPDQLLAASLVSHGLITTQQIVALGHIRQELHAIGLEYDLENLLILFRLLTPDQLREVRASWQG